MLVSGTGLEEESGSALGCCESSALLGKAVPGLPRQTASENAGHRRLRSVRQEAGVQVAIAILGCFEPSGRANLHEQNDSFV